MADTPSGETVPPVTPSNEPSATPAPATPAPAPVENPEEVAKLQREQIEMRANQIANAKIAEAKKALEDEAAKTKLAEQNEYKTLYEQSEAKRLEAEAAKVAEAKVVAVKTASDAVLAEFSPEVRKLAETTGLALTDADESTVAAFKAKLEEIKGMVGGTPVTPNNPNAPVPGKPSIYDEKGMISQELQGDKFDQIAASMPGIASMFVKPPQQT